MTNLFSQGKIIRQFWGKIIRQSTNKDIKYGDKVKKIGFKVTNICLGGGSF